MHEDPKCVKLMYIAKTGLLLRSRTSFAGSKQEEVGALVKASIDDKKISGNDRSVAWDGQTRSGPALHNQINAIVEDKVGCTEK